MHETVCLLACMCNKSALFKCEEKISRLRIWQRKWEVCIVKVGNVSRDSKHPFLVILPESAWADLQNSALYFLLQSVNIRVQSHYSSFLWEGFSLTNKVENTLNLRRMWNEDLNKFGVILKIRLSHPVLKTTSMFLNYAAKKTTGFCFAIGQKIAISPIRILF